MEQGWISYPGAHNLGLCCHGLLQRQMCLCGALLQMPACPEATRPPYLHNILVAHLLGEVLVPAVHKHLYPCSEQPEAGGALCSLVPPGVRNKVLLSAMHTRSHSGHPEADLML